MPKCKRCRKESPRLSQHGLCIECSQKAVAESVKQMRAKKGRHYRKWLRRMKEAIEREEGNKMKVVCKKCGMEYTAENPDVFDLNRWLKEFHNKTGCKATLHDLEVK